METIHQYLQDFNQVVTTTEITIGTELASQEDGYSAMIEAIKTTEKKNGVVYLVGNGGSSGIISHMAIDLLNACKVKAYPMTDNSVLTCIANDYGYEQVFSEPLKTLINENDLLIAVSSSGNSKNIINAVLSAKEKNATAITLSGFKNDNPLRSTGDINLWLNNSRYGFVEIGHSLLLHYLIDCYHQY